MGRQFWAAFGAACVVLAVCLAAHLAWGPVPAEPAVAIPPSPDVPPISYTEMPDASPPGVPDATEGPGVAAEPGVEVVDRSEMPEGDPMARDVDFGPLLERNGAVAFWLSVPGTGIDYPVLQEARVGEYYYLRRDMDGRYSRSGWLFTPAVPEGPEDMHMLVFGHNMGGGSTVMFGTLGKYKDQAFCSDHSYAYLYYPDRTERWRVFAAANVVKDDDVYSMPYESGTEDYGSLLEHLAGASLYDTGVQAPGNTIRTLVLSTCDRSYGGQSGRFIVALEPDAVAYNT